MSQLGDDFPLHYKEKTGKTPSSALITHCKRELMQAIWNQLMDERFMGGCKDGITIQCSDGIEWVFYIHIMTYSADYPEK